MREASANFTKALDENPSFEKARFERGRSRIALGELDLAMDDFGILARRGDALSMAYIGFCFNLKRVPVAAIPWYERAIESGYSSVALYNNLGASYLSARTSVTNEEQLRLAELYLSKAFEIENGSIAIRLNLVRLAIVKSKADPSHDPLVALPHVKAILASGRISYVILDQLGLWHRTVAWHDENRLQQSPDLVSDANRQPQEAFLQVQELVSEMDKAIPRKPITETDGPPAGTYFLEPLWLPAKHGEQALAKKNF
jgi:tetratricopeptide (TPR) repeat protein